MEAWPSPLKRTLGFFVIYLIVLATLVVPWPFVGKVETTPWPLVLIGLFLWALMIVSYIFSTVGAMYSLFAYRRRLAYVGTSLMVLLSNSGVLGWVLTH